MAGSSSWGADRDQSVRLVAIAAAGRVPGIELESRPQDAHVAPGGTDLPQHPCCSERSATGQEVVVEGADACWVTTRLNRRTWAISVSSIP